MTEVNKLAVGDKIFSVTFQSNNSDIVIVDTVTAVDLLTAITAVKTLLQSINSVVNIPHDFRIKSVTFSGTVTA